VEALGVSYFFEHVIKLIFLFTLQSSFGWLSQIFVLRKLQNTKPNTLSLICQVEALGVGYFFQLVLRFIFLLTLQLSIGWQ